MSAFQDSAQSTRGSSETREEKSRTTSRKGRNGTSLFADDVHGREPEFPARELQMKHHVIRVTGYKFNRLNSEPVYAPKTNTGKEIMNKQTPFCNNLKEI